MSNSTNNSIISQILHKIKKAENIYDIISNRTNTYDKRFICDKCGKEYIISNNKLGKVITDLYLNTEKNLDNIKLFCSDECENSYDGNTNVISQQPKGPRWVKCNKCGKEYKLSKLEFKKRAKAIANGANIDESRYLCDECVKNILDDKFNNIMNKINHPTQIAKSDIITIDEIDSIIEAEDLMINKSLNRIYNAIRLYNYSKFKLIYEFFSSKVIPVVGSMTTVFKQMDDSFFEFISETTGKIFMIDKKILLNLLYKCYNEDDHNIDILFYKNKPFNIGATDYESLICNNSINTINSYESINFDNIEYKAKSVLYKFQNSFNEYTEVENTDVDNTVDTVSIENNNNIVYSVNTSPVNSLRKVNIELNENDSYTVTANPNNIVITISVKS